MSFQAVLAAIAVDDPRLEIGEKFLLVVLGSYANTDRTLYPSQETLASDISATSRSVRSYLSKLEELGYISRRKRRSDGKQISDLITLEFQPETLSARWGKQPETGDISAGNRRPFQPEMVSGNPVSEPSKNPPVSSLRSETTREQVAFEAYNRIARELELPVCLKLTPQRRTHLRARLSEHGLDGFLHALEGLRAPFCQGDNDRGWRASFDFVLQAKSCAKLADNAYEHAAPRLPVSPGMIWAAEREAGSRAFLAANGLGPNGEPLNGSGRDQGPRKSLPSPRSD